jgi:guanyl-specific ribonuclease Sa
MGASVPAFGWGLRGLAGFTFLHHLKNYEETGDQRELGRAGLAGLGAFVPEEPTGEGPLLSGPGPSVSGGAQVARITAGTLPAAEEASVLRSLAHIDAGTTPSGPLAIKWGAPFKNWSGDLPGPQGPASPYREYRVAPTTGSSSAGTQRIVVNSQTGEVYYTWTHYGDSGSPAFVRIR